MYVPKKKGGSSSKGNEDVKTISVHSNLFYIVKEPIATSEFPNFLTRSLIIDKNKESPMDNKYAIEELHTKDDNT